MADVKVSESEYGYLVEISGPFEVKAPAEWVEALADEARSEGYFDAYEASRALLRDAGHPDPSDVMGALVDAFRAYIAEHPHPAFSTLSAHNLAAAAYRAIARWVPLIEPMNLFPKGEG